jgi:hypothetical protein
LRSIDVGASRSRSPSEETPAVFRRRAVFVVFNTQQLSVHRDSGKVALSRPLRHLQGCRLQKGGVKKRRQPNPAGVHVRLGQGLLQHLDCSISQGEHRFHRLAWMSRLSLVFHVPFRTGHLLACSYLTSRLTEGRPITSDCGSVVASVEVKGMGKREGERYPPPRRSPSGLRHCEGACQGLLPCSSRH